MRCVYFDGSAGASGDMILGALLDLGFPVRDFQKRISGLGLPVRIKVARVQRGAMNGLRVDVRPDGRSSAGRTYKDISAFIGRSGFPAGVKDRAKAVFSALFKAEAKVHGRSFEKAHLHEAGADDALVDVLGTCHLLHALEVEKIYASPLNVGSGWVRTSHGALPVPPPAVAELLRRVPVYSAWAETELVTPTGAALLVTLAEDFVAFPEIRYEKIGYGAGAGDHRGFSNVLRVFLGRGKSPAPPRRMFLIEANIDDATPQLLAAFLEKALKLGAADATLTPVVMKKGRLAVQLTLLASSDRIEDLIAGIFRETTSIGVRYYPVERRVLDREKTEVRVAGESVAVKVAEFQGRTANAQPEYSDCLGVASRKGLPLKEVLRLASEAYWKKAPRKTGRR